MKKCPNCKTEIYPTCQQCKKEIKGGVGMFNLYVQSPTNKYSRSGKWWREWTKLRLCPSCYRKTAKKLKEIMWFSSDN